jgi:ADP-ribose pyrophosphatase
MPDAPATKLSSRTAFSGRIFSVDVDRVRMPHGREVSLEVVRHPESVVLLPMPDADHVILVRQYRYAVDRWLWELPAGSVDSGEDPERAAARECHEEIGLIPGRVKLLAALLPTPGYCDEKMNFFLLESLMEPECAAEQDEDEVIETRSFTIEEARLLVRAGEIVDMKTAVGLMLIG